MIVNREPLELPLRPGRDLQINDSVGKVLGEATEGI